MGMQFIASGNSMAARDLVLSVFHHHQWRITLVNDWEASIEHGSKSASFWGGAWAGKEGRHVVLNMKVSMDPHGNTAINLQEGTTGFSGGVIGVAQANDVYQTMFNHVGMALSGAGVYLACSKT